MLDWSGHPTDFTLECMTSLAFKRTFIESTALDPVRGNQLFDFFEKGKVLKKNLKRFSEVNKLVKPLLKLVIELVGEDLPKIRAHLSWFLENMQ